MTRTARSKNESSVNLAGAATYNGTVIDTHAPDLMGSQYFQASAFASHTGTLFIDACDDNVFTAGDEVAKVAIAATTPGVLKVPILGRFMRVRYTNGATPTTTLRIKTSVTAT